MVSLDDYCADQKAEKQKVYLLDSLNKFYIVFNMLFIFSSIDNFKFVIALHRG